MISPPCGPIILIPPLPLTNKGHRRYATNLTEKKARD